MATPTNTGLPRSDQPRYHFDIYALLEGTQELYFGHETQVNVNWVETVRIADEAGGEMVKCYISPTKRRGVERRSLIWAPVRTNGMLLGDVRGCGVPHTCAQPDCPICAIYGGLITGDTEVEVLGQTVKRKGTTTIGRLVHSGGVAVQAQDAAEKQRAMHPSMLHKAPGEPPTPTPFKRQYNEPGLLYPVSNHCLSVTEAEFGAAAYAFLDSLSRLGAGNPKGVRLFDATWEAGSNAQPLLVVDRYLVPLGKRPLLSPRLTDAGAAMAAFVSAARTVPTAPNQNFSRWTGDEALTQLQRYALQFAEAHLA